VLRRYARWLETEPTYPALRTVSNPTSCWTCRLKLCVVGIWPPGSEANGLDVPNATLAHFVPTVSRFPQMNVGTTLKGQPPTPAKAIVLSQMRSWKSQYPPHITFFPFPKISKSKPMLYLKKI